MNKKVLGIAIPYYKNSEECEKTFQQLMIKINQQLTDDMILYIYEDGQISDWLDEYKNKNNIIVIQNKVNKGVSHARNKALDYLLKKVLYVLFLDSDDNIDDNFLQLMYMYCADNTHDIIEPAFYVNNCVIPFNPSKIRGGVSSSAIKSKIIGDIRFEEKLQIGEDTKFMKDVCDLTIHRKKYCPTNYYYQFGINRNSLSKLYERKEIEKER